MEDLIRNGTEKDDDQETGLDISLAATSINIQGQVNHKDEDAFDVTESANTARDDVCEKEREPTMTPDTLQTVR